MKHTKLISLILVLVLALSLCACGSSKTPASGSDLNAAQPTPAPVENTPEPEPENTPEPPAEPEIDPELPINIMTLNGTTGFGMAKLINDAAQGSAALNYSISVETDAANITGALVNGSVDIAALPTNAAAVVYNKTEGAVQVLALNTLGVLYLVVNSENETVSSLADLEGKTVYAPAQNPSFIFSYICQAAGVNVTIDNSYAQPADLRTAVAAGEIDIAVLPEPMVTIALSSNDKLAVALDLTEEWNQVAPEGSLVQGCVVVRREFAEAHPAEVAQFLKDYEASIDYLFTDTADAAEMIVAAGIFTAAPVAQKAIPKCNLCFIAGEDMQPALSEFLNIMFEVAPASIGGAVPADDFYYVG
ncbi:MAG: ABC transporter substrate-binding protein [Oscillospiraceae bacterium]